MKNLFLMALTLSMLSACGFEVVDTGYRGIKARFGEVIGEPLPEGLHFYNPITSGIREINVQERKIEDTTTAFTRDTQSVTIAFAVTLYPDPLKIHLIYKQFGEHEWEKKIAVPAVISSIKDVIGQYTADDIIGKREAARNKAFDEIQAALKARDVIATRLDFTNLDFEDGYEHAVEAKVIAVQKAAEAKNKTVEVEEQAKQVVLSAKAEAESMKIKSAALAQNKGLVQFEAVQKWDGKLPVNMYGSAPLPFLNLKQE